MSSIGGCGYFLEYPNVSRGEENSSRTCLVCQKNIGVLFMKNIETYSPYLYTLLYPSNVYLKKIS